MNIGKNKESRVSQRIIGLVILAVVAVFLLVTFSKGISIKMNDSTLAVSGGIMYSDKIDYSKINKVELRDKVNYGNRDNGMDLFSIETGFFSNKEFGKYKLYVNTNAGKFIVINYDDNKVAVFNQKDAASTEKLYNDLNEKIKK